MAHYFCRFCSGEPPPKFAHSTSSASVIALCLFCQLKGFVREFLTLVDEIVPLPTRG